MAKKKSPAQLDREIAASLAIAGATTPHSAKALVTLAQMGTTPSQWKITPIKWVDEEREVTGWVECPTCHGRKFVRIDASGSVIPRPPRGTNAADEYDTAARRDAYQANRNHGNCPRCGKQTRGWGMIPQGSVKGLVRREVKVGYPQFPAGTRFDSRFGSGMNCALCNKLILKSGRVPVHATGADGVKHGMFVGEDCGKKFLDVKLKRDEDSIMETGNAPL